MVVGGQRHASATLPLEKTRYPFYRRLGGPQGLSGWVRKISPSLGFDPRTVPLVASRYTDCAIPSPCRYVHIPICLAYLKWMDTISCSQSWENDWTDVWCLWTSVQRICSLCGVLEVLLWLIFVVLKLFIPCILNHYFLYMPILNLECAPWWWHGYA